MEFVKINEANPIAVMEAKALDHERRKRMHLEVVVKNGTKLKNVHWNHSLKTFPAVFIADKDGTIFYNSEKQKPVDINGGSNPVWNTYNEFNVDIVEALQKKLYLYVRIESKSQVACFGSKFVGEASVGIEDLLNDFDDDVDMKSITLRVKNKKGKEHGSVTFKYKFGKTDHDPQPAAPLPQPADPPLPQPAGGNSVARMCYNIFRAVVVGGTSGVVTFVCDLLRDSL